MVTQQLLDYIKQQTQMGKSQADIHTALLSGGWLAADVDQAFTSINSGTPLPAPTSSELPKARQIFKDSWAIYKNRFITLVGINLISTAGFVIVSLLTAGVVAMAGNLLKNSTTSIQVWIFGGFILAAVVFIFLIYIAIWSAVAQLFAIKDQAEGIGWKESFRRSRPSVWPFFTTSFLAGLAIMGGLILLVIPGIIFALWFSQVGYIVVSEGLNNTAALKRSKYYITGRLGKVFGKFFYIGIITFGLYIGMGIAISILTAITKGAYFGWLGNIFSLIWGPMATVYGYQLYRHLKSSRS